MSDVPCIIQTYSTVCLPTHSRERAASVLLTYHLASTSVYQTTCVLIEMWRTSG